MGDSGSSPNLGLERPNPKLGLSNRLICKICCLLF